MTNTISSEIFSGTTIKVFNSVYELEVKEGHNNSDVKLLITEAIKIAKGLKGMVQFVYKNIVFSVCQNSNFNDVYKNWQETINGTCRYVFPFRTHEDPETSNTGLLQQAA